SKSSTRSMTRSSWITACIIQSGFPRSGRSTIGTSSAQVCESAVAKSVTWCPCRTSSSVRYETTRSVPPYCRGGTLSNSGATCAIRTRPPLVSLERAVKCRNCRRGWQSGRPRLRAWRASVASAVLDAHQDPQHLGDAPRLRRRSHRAVRRLGLEALGELTQAAVLHRPQERGDGRVRLAPDPDRIAAHGE